MSAILWMKNSAGVKVQAGGGPAAPATEPTGAAQRVALFASAAELTYWQSVYDNISTGSSHKNSRMSEDRARIETWKNYVDTNSTSSLMWTLSTAPSTGPIRKNNTDPRVDESAARASARRCEGAAFYAFLKGNTSIRDKVKAALVALPTQPAIGFQDFSRWVLEAHVSGNERWRDTTLFAIAHAMTSYLTAYDLTVAAGATYTTTQQNLIRDWHLGFARQSDYDFRDLYERSNHFPQRQSDSYPTSGITTSMWTSAGGPYLWNSPTDGQNRVRAIHNLFNNRWGSHARHQGLVGIVFDNAYHRDQAKRWHREFIMFGSYPDGATSDFHRVNDTGDNGHMGYPTLQLAHWTAFADALARTGDRSVYDFASTVGVFTSEGNSTEGGSQSMLKLNRQMCKHYNQTYARFALGGGRLDGRSINRGDHVHRLVQQNNYYRDSLLEQSTSVASGMPPWAPATGEGSIGDAGAVIAPMFRWIDIAANVPHASIYP